MLDFGFVTECWRLFPELIGSWVEEFLVFRDMCSYNGGNLSDLGPYSRRHEVRCTKELPCGVFCLNVTCTRVGTWSHLLIYLQSLKQCVAPYRCSGQIGPVHEWPRAGKAVNLVGFKIPSVLFAGFFLDWPYLRVRKLFGREIHPCWGAWHVEMPVLRCARCWRWNGTKDLIQDLPQCLDHCGFYVSTMSVIKDISLDWPLLKY